jgi:hypothetical protein
MLQSDIAKPAAKILKGPIHMSHHRLSITTRNMINTGAWMIFSIASNGDFIETGQRFNNVGFFHFALSSCGTHYDSC